MRARLGRDTDLDVDHRRTMQPRRVTPECVRLNNSMVECRDTYRRITETCFLLESHPTNTVVLPAVNS